MYYSHLIKMEKYDKQLNRSDLSLILDEHINQTDHNHFEQALVDIRSRLFNLEKNGKIPGNDYFELPVLRRQYATVNGTAFILEMISSLNTRITKIEKRVDNYEDHTNDHNNDHNNDIELNK